MGNTVAPPAAKTSVSFVLNGRQVVVDGVSPLVSLNEWIRAQPGLSGTKRMCGEGGCGCCVVAAAFVDQVTKRSKTIAINSVSGSMLHVTSVKLLLISWEKQDSLYMGSGVTRSKRSDALPGREVEERPVLIGNSPRGVTVN